MAYWIRQFFDPRGRLNRAKFWLFFAIYYGTGVAFVAIVLSISAAELRGTAAIAINVAMTAIAIAMLAGAIIVPIKRLHDRGKSGWWWIGYLCAPAIVMVPLVTLAPKADLPPGFLASFVAAGFVFGVWIFIELGALRGTVGNNRFGPDPLAKAPD